MPESIVVLHVDDEPAFADLAAEFLERHDERFEVVTETSAEDGLESLKHGSVDCIVSDYDMPETDGLEFLERVRDEDEDRPFILFTGKGSEKVASEALSNGATDYLQKQPGTEQYEILANRILNYVQTARSETQRRRQLEAIETAEEGISILDQDGEFIFVNEAYADLYGYEPEAMYGEHYSAIYPDEELDRVESTILPELEAEGHWRGETIGQRADGTTFVEDHRLSLTEDGEMICTVRDVTERREQKLALERYRTIVEAMGDGVYAMDAEGNYIHVNEVVCEQFGLEYEALLETDPREFYSEEDVDRFEAAIQELLRNEDEHIATIRATAETQSGDEIPVETSLTLLPMPDGEFRGTVGVVRDVRDRIDEAQERGAYRKAFESALSPIAIADADERLVAVNDALLDLWGYEDESAVLGRHIGEFWADHVDISAVVDDIAEQGGEWRGRLPAALADGTSTQVRCATSLLTDETDRITGLVSAFLDVSDQRRRQAQLERYETLLDVIPDTVVLTDLDGMIQDIHGFEGWSGYEYDDLVGTHISAYLPADSLEQAESVVGELLRSEERSQCTVEHVIETKAGEPVPFESHMTLLPPDAEDGMGRTISVLRDISARKQRERELERQNERLEEFARIVSHDLRNPLNVATGRLELAKRDTDSHHLEELEGALERMAVLIDDLLAVSTGNEDVMEFETLHLAEVASESWEGVPTDGATLEVDADRTVEADESRLKQLLENLFRNAVDHAEGPVTVRLGTPADAGGFYVADDGAGIPADRRKHLFERGYSTGENGTGLGLSIVEDVAAAHGWDVRVTESASGGARFELG